MIRIPRTVRRQLKQARGVEWFVQLIVGGGIGLVAGLWAVELTEAWSIPWLFGIGLVLLAVAWLGYGLWSQIEY